MAFKDFLVGKPGKFQQIPTLSQPQQNLANFAGGGGQNLLQMLLGNIMGGGMQSGGMQGGLGGIGTGFAPIAQRARTQFQQQTIPSIAERFTAMGEGAQSSPAFAQLLGQAGAGLEEGLAAQEAQYGLQQQGLLQALLGQLLGVGLTPQFETAYMPSQPGFLQSLLGGGLQALPQVYGARQLSNNLGALGRQAGGMQ